MRKLEPQTAAMPPKLEEGSPSERIQVVAPASWIDRVEAWRRQQPRIPSRSEAIRILVDKALKAGERQKEKG